MEIVLLGVIIVTFLFFVFLVCCFVLSAKELEEKIGNLGYEKKRGIEQMDVAEKIRYFRQQKGLSQEQLGKRAGIHENTIRKYELGIRKPKLDQLKKIAGGLGVSVIEFIDIEIENEADLIAVLKKISPFFKWENIGRILEQGEQR